VPFSGIAVAASWMGKSDREPKGAKMNDDSEDIPMAYLLYVVLGILLVAAGTLLFIIRMF
jgi:hypothetical protein